VVVTLRSLQGIDWDFGVALGRAWQIGQKDKNNGVLLISAERAQCASRSATGLKGRSPTPCRASLSRTRSRRAFVKTISPGISRGVDDIISVLTRDAEE
jgi:uncharacterized protein